MISGWHLLWIIPLCSFLSFFISCLCTASSRSDNITQAYLQEHNNGTKTRNTQLHIKLNPDREVVDEISKKLKDNGGYCPCSLVKTPDTKCQCRDFKEQVSRGEKGFCHCGLWYAE